MRLKTRIKRFTGLPNLLDMLLNKQLTLLNPRSWEDRNDSFYIEQYRNKKKLKSVLALCFASCPETFHHWKVFSSGSSGVCIEFDKSDLLGSLPSLKGLRNATVQYKLIKELSKMPPRLTDWPFLKRKPFQDEHEFRIIYESDTESIDTKAVSFDLTAVKRITLSPWLSKPVAESVKEVIRGIDGCEELNLSQSLLVDTISWRNAILREPKLAIRLANR